MKKIEELKKAQEKFVLKREYELTENLLKYIVDRIEANKKEIIKLKELKTERYSYERIIEAIKKEVEENGQFKKYGNMYINEEGFLNTEMLMPIGTIAVECYDTLEVVRYFIKAIKSRNAIAISDVEYIEKMKSYKI